MKNRTEIYLLIQKHNGYSAVLAVFSEYSTAYEHLQKNKEFVSENNTFYIETHIIDLHKKTEER